MAGLNPSPAMAQSPIDNPYASEIQPILVKYCVGCHNENDHESNLKLHSLASIRSGGDAGPALIPSKPEESLILRRLLGIDEPKMPPEDSPQPSPAEIEKIKGWIAQGALGSDPANSLADKWLRIAANAKQGSGTSPAITPHGITPHGITAAAIADSGQVLLGRFSQVELRDLKTNSLKSASPFIGKITQIRLDRDSKRAAIAGGIPGLGGLVQVLELDSLAKAPDEPWGLKSIEAHNDVLYCAVLHPTEPWVATAGYDRTIRLWNYQTGKLLRSFEGHNGAVYDLDFDPTGVVLASASADETIKVWRVDSGTRLDTLGQGEAEQLRVRLLRPTESTIEIIATGADRRIRHWRLPSLEQPSVSPMLHSIFAHESTIHQLALSADHRRAATAAQDGTIKIWDTERWELIADLPPSKDLLTSLSWSLDGSALQWTTLAGGLQGRSIADALMSKTQQQKNELVPSAIANLSLPNQKALEVAQIEESKDGPRSVQNAQLLATPAKVSGVLKTEDTAKGGDWYAFDSKKGQVWSIGIFAARDKSPLDSHLEITDEKAQPLLRTRLQAVRESYFTFRGKDSTTIDDFRLHRWEDMQLNEWLYASGEVVRLWLYPRGPDSGFKVYPGFGKRYTYFGTSPIAHALNEPAWIVRELQDDQPPVSNGLPVFPIFYSNDDDPFRQGGKDSWIEFIAPHDGRFYVRVRDIRGLGGEDFRYQLSITEPNPRFVFRLETSEITLRPDVGTEFVVSAERFDGLDADIQVEFEQVPSGLKVVEPLTIEKGQLKAIGQFRPAEGALSEIPKEFEISLVAKIRMGQQEFIAAEKPKIKVKVNEKPTMKLKLVGIQDPDDGPPIETLRIRPGQTISAKLVIERGELAGDIAFGGDDSGRNLPHGCFVDNIGLNGLLIPAGQSTREVFITAAPTVEPQRRVFHLRGNVDGNPTSLPVELVVE